MKIFNLIFIAINYLAWEKKTLARSGIAVSENAYSWKPDEQVPVPPFHTSFSLSE